MYLINEGDAHLSITTAEVRYPDLVALSLSFWFMYRAWFTRLPNDLMSTYLFLLDCVWIYTRWVSFCISSVGSNFWVGERSSFEDFPASLPYDLATEAVFLNYSFNAYSHGWFQYTSINDKSLLYTLRMVSMQRWWYHLNIRTYMIRDSRLYWKIDSTKALYTLNFVIFREVFVAFSCLDAFL